MLWDSLQDEHLSLLAKSNLFYKPYKSLIDMCERIMISSPASHLINHKSLKCDLKNLNEACDAIKKLYKEFVLPMVV
jgi:hypothetical protein